MKFKKITEAHQNFGQLVRLVEEDNEDVILVRNGKPCILIRKMDEDALEDYIVAKHAGLEKLAKDSSARVISLATVEERLGLHD